MEDDNEDDWEPSPFCQKMNGAVCAANKNIKKIMQKMVVMYKDWHEMLPVALHGYRTSVCTSTGATPFYLVYGMEASSTPLWGGNLILASINGNPIRRGRMSSIQTWPT